MSSCIVPMCQSNSNIEEKVYTFSVPKDPNLLKIWQRKIPRLNRVIQKGEQICEKHFAPDQLVKTSEVSSLPNDETFNSPRKKARLVSGAVPSVFLNSPTYTSSVQKKPKEVPKKRHAKSPVATEFSDLTDEPRKSSRKRQKSTSATSFLNKKSSRNTESPVVKIEFPDIIDKPRKSPKRRKKSSSASCLNKKSPENTESPVITITLPDEGELNDSARTSPSVHSSPFMISPERLHNCLRKYKERRRIAKRIIKHLLKQKPRLSNILAYKFFVLRWFLKQNCMFVINDIPLLCIPKDWINKSRFQMMRIDEELVLHITEELSFGSILVSLRYCGSDDKCTSISKCVKEITDKLPNIENVSRARSEDRDDLIHKYIDFANHLEIKFYEQVLWYINHGKRPPTVCDSSDSE